ncbi:MAG: NUDIX domain-containing protein [Rikenellaceae bacterium]
MEIAEIENQIQHLTNKPVESFIKLVEASSIEELCNRKNAAGHITASGTIVHLIDREVLLLHHKFLNAWHVPGGHIDYEDDTTVAAALREVEEETGITSEQLIPLNVSYYTQYCVEINSHPIPYNSKKMENAHYHHDFRYVFGYEGTKEISIDSKESIDYKWVSIDDECLTKIIDIEQLKLLLNAYEEDIEMDFEMDLDFESELYQNKYVSLEQMEYFARFDIVRTKDKSGVKYRNDRHIFNKSEGKYLWFYTESDNFQPCEIDWEGEMTIEICGSDNSIKHKCKQCVDETTISVNEYIDLSTLACGEYSFELAIDGEELYEFTFDFVDLPSTYQKYAKFDGLCLQGVLKNDELSKGEKDINQTLTFKKEEVKSLSLSFSFSEIHEVDIFQCMVAIYNNNDFFDYDLAEYEDSITYNSNNEPRDLDSLVYNRVTHDYSLIRGKYLLELRILGEVVTTLDFNII